MRSFADAFHHHVTPELQRLCEREAIPVAWELKDFSAAHAVVLREARRRGAQMLSDHLWHELDRWISCTILTEVEKHIPAVQAQAEASERAWADICKWERELARRGFGREIIAALADGALATLG